MASIRPGKSRVIVTVSVVAGTNVTAGGGSGGIPAAPFLPQAGSSSKIEKMGKNKIGRMRER